MKKISRKMLLFAMTFIIVAGTAFYGACTANSLSIVLPATGSITINSSSINLILGDTQILYAEYSEEEWVQFNWKSSNEKVVTVDEYGVVSAVGLGTAEVSASYGEAIGVCIITVGTGNFAPSLRATHGYGHKINAFQNQSYDLSYVIDFNGKTFTDGEISYVLRGDDIAKIENGVLTLTGKGTVTVDVSCTWQGMNYPSLKDSLEVECTDNVELFVNGGMLNSVYLYTIDNFDGKTYCTEEDFNVQVFENGEEKQDFTVSVADGGEDMISITNDKITALSYGQTFVEIIYETENESYVKNVPVTVERPVAPYSTKIEQFSAADGYGDLDLDTVFGEDRVVNAMQTTEPLTVSYTDLGELRILGVMTSPLGLTVTQIAVYTEKYGYIFELEGYTKIIRSAEDLKYFNFGTDIEWAGYYVLANDIDASAYTHVHNGTGMYNEYAFRATAKGGLSGTFDGQGYVISGITFSSGGLFQNITRTGKVKNVAFIGVKFTDADVVSVLASNMQCGTANEEAAMLQNIYIQADSMPTGANSALICAWQMGAYVRFQSCVIECEESSMVANAFKTLENNVQGTLNISAQYMKDVYFITPTTLVFTNGKADAQNREAEAAQTGAQKFYPSIYRYDTKADWLVSSHDYSAFDTDFWSIASGVPVWRTDEISILFGGIETYNVSMTEGESLAVEVYDGGEPIDYDLVITEGEEYLSFANGELKALSYGTAELTITVHAEDGDAIRNISVIINKKKIISDYDGVIENFSAADGYGDLRLEEIFGTDEIVSVTQNGESLTIEKDEQGRMLLFGLRTVNTGITNTEIVVTTEEYGYKIPVRAYTKIIRNAQDLTYFNYKKLVDAETAFSSWDGYFILANDIDATGYVHLHEVSNAEILMSDSTVGLLGTFDGQGYAINNLTVGSGGLFAVVNKGTIKNVAFTNVTYQSGTSDSTLLAKFILSGLWNEKHATLENIYIQAENTANSAAAVAYSVGLYTEVHNVVVEISEKSTTSGSFKKSDNSSQQLIISNDTNYSDVYVLSPTPLLIDGTKIRDAVEYKDTPGLDAYYPLIHRYETRQDMENADLDFGSFSETYWDISGGTPVWRSLAE